MSGVMRMNSLKRFFLVLMMAYTIFFWLLIALDILYWLRY
jgi:hypothetical protein